MPTPEQRERKAAYMREYYAKFPEKLERKRTLARERMRKKRADGKYLVEEKVRRLIGEIQREYSRKKDRELGDD